MRLIVDECIGPGVVRWLRSEGHDVVSIFESARGSADLHILTQAVQHGRIVITADKDFGDLVFRDGLPHRGVVLLRLDDKTTRNTRRVLAALFNHYADEIEHAFVVVSETSVRVSRSGRTST